MNTTTTTTQQKLDASLSLLNHALIGFDLGLEKDSRYVIESEIKEHGFEITVDEVMEAAQKVMDAYKKIQDMKVWVAGKATGF